MCQIYGSRKHVERTDLQNDELQLCDIVCMHPVFGGLPYKILLPAPRSTIAFDWISPCADKVIQLRQLNDEGIVVVLEKRFGF